MTAKLPCTLLRLALAVAIAAPASAQALAPGEALPPLELTDQHDRPAPLRPPPRIVLFAADMAGSQVAGAVLGGEPPGVLDRLGARYVADISAMPAMVSTMFALPAMKALSFPVALVRDKGVVQSWPRRKGSVTVLRLGGERVVAVEYADDEGALRKALSLPEPASAPATTTEPAAGG